MYIVYQIVNKLSNSLYIGVSKNYPSRIRSHKHSMRSGTKTPLYDAMRSYGLECFEFRVYVCCLSESGMYALEKELIKEFTGDGYKLYNLAEGGCGGYALPEGPEKEAWKNKLKEARVGRKPALGMKHSSENRELFSRVSQEYWESQDTYDSDEVLKFGFTESNRRFGISKTHYYRLRKRALGNDQG